ncbi:MAG: acetate--CoA ligase family protein [Deltaproteobacteria bacterium]|nr:acetate--CoA ligase family protein [Deltaproteobacteria bacterium]
MLNPEIQEIVAASKPWGWVLEPDAKRIFSLVGINVTNFTWSRTVDEALRFAETNGYPVVAKVVSPKVVHKTEQKGVILGIHDAKALAEAFHRLNLFDGARGVLVEESLHGVEMIVGAKIDFQFGPVILMGIGGTSVEIYQDTSLRMAPITPEDAESMMRGLKAHRILEGYRGAESINRNALSRMLTVFSDLMMALGETVSSIDLNPVFCSAEKCVVGDARIMLPS